MKKKTASTKAPAPKTDPLDTVRRLMRSTGFDEEEYENNQLLFSSREEGDVLEGRADPGVVRFAREKAKEIETALPGAKARVEVVDEWVSIAVTLPGAAPAAPPPPPSPLPAPPETRKRYLKPGDEIEYTNFTIGGSYEGKAVVTWDHGKSVEARTLGGERIRLERAQDGSLRRLT